MYSLLARKQAPGANKQEVAGEVVSA
jgi:hypothetical protein